MVVNGVLAVVAGSEFAAIIPLRVGRNTLTATATTAGGLQAQTSVTVNTERQEENILLRVYPGTGILSLTTNPLKVVFEAETYLSDPIISCAWDFNGDGIPEITGIDLKTVGEYQTPGLFFPRVTVIDNRGNIYSEIAVVNVLSREELDYLLRSKWEGMSGRLLEGDVDRAMEFFNESKGEAYRRLLKRLSAHLPAIVSGMSDIQLIEYRDRAIFYDIQTSIKGEAYSFPLRFEKDINGIWKITSF